MCFVMKSFNGNRLKTARQYRGLTVEELAQKINVSKQAVSQYETGRIEDVPFQRILSISNALNFPYKYFSQEKSLLNICNFYSKNNKFKYN